MYGGGKAERVTGEEKFACNLQIRSRHNSTSFENLCATYGNVLAQICIRGRHYGNFSR